NLAEERHRVRTLRRRARTSGRAGIEGSPAWALAELPREEATGPALRAHLERLRISPVLTAHPTEARRRTLLLALQRCAGLVERLDDSRLTPEEDAELRRRLREEITILWRTTTLRLADRDRRADRAAPGDAARPRRGRPLGLRPPTRPAVPRRALPPSTRRDGRAAPADPCPADGAGGPALRTVRVGERPRRRGRR